MTFIDSLWVSLLGIAVVFAVLILLSFFITILSRVLAFIVKDGRETDGDALPGRNTGSETQGAGGTVPYILGEPDGEWSTGELKLIGVDEKTAAMIMAIVSDESEIPLSQLQFKTIKAIDSSL
ncbi:MAG TPA: OadG family protein [Syntrophomonadaceae bacterium]|nr:OadG family protein [Syntrophomonadaceae bacterium]